MIGWIIIGVVVVLLALWAVGIYNGLIKLRNLVQEAWRQIDVELKRRHDLIGNLVETVKGYAAHERGTLEDVMKARSAAMAGGQSPAQQAQSEGLLSAALGRLSRWPRPTPTSRPTRTSWPSSTSSPPPRTASRRPAGTTTPTCASSTPGWRRAQQHGRRHLQHRARRVLRGRGRGARAGAGGLRPARGHDPAAERVCRGHAAGRPCRTSAGWSQRARRVAAGHLSRNLGVAAAPRRSPRHTGWAPDPRRFTGRLQPVAREALHRGRGAGAGCCCRPALLRSGGVRGGVGLRHGVALEV